MALTSVVARPPNAAREGSIPLGLGPPLEARLKVRGSDIRHVIFKKSLNIIYCMSLDSKKTEEKFK